ncbi:MAG: phosphoribosylglycinamide formyltransferase [Gammaproteobacteria bacterium]|nr:phosphoribosylglycinamide formyltransferase [Gammaproteobacteria bacterium]
MIRIAVLASHGGSVLQAVIDAIEAGGLPVEVVLVISNNSQSQALTRAVVHGIATMHLSGRTHPDPDDLDTAMTGVLQTSDPDWILLAGYMKRLGPRTLAAFRNKILNTHPALLPRHGGKGFYGRHVHQAVLEAGDTESGATVHLVDGEYDSGPILSQVRVPVKSIDNAQTLEERVQVAERKLIVATLAELAERREAAGY